MTVPLDSSMQKAERLSGVSLALLMSLLFVLLLSGCESPSSTPGSLPGGAVPGRPGGVGGPKGPGQSLGTPGVKSSASVALKPVGGQTPVVQTASALLPAKPGSLSPDSASPLSPEKTPPAGTISAPNVSPVNALGPTTKVEQAGNTVELASSIIAAKANPFLDWLPKALVSSQSSGDSSSAASSTATPADPFDGVTLLGVMSHGKKAMALIGINDGQSQFAEKGSVIALGAGMAKVIAVRSDEVDLQLLGKEAQTRTLSLPDIIGYSSAATSGATGQGDAAATQSMPSLGAPGGSSSDKTNSALENLKQLFEQSSGGRAASSPGASAQVNLQEH